MTIDQFLKEYELGQRVFKNLDFDREIFNNIKMSGIYFVECSLSNCAFWNCDLSNSKFIHSDLKCVDFNNSNLTGALIQECSVEQTIWGKTITTDVKLENAYCYGAILNQEATVWLFANGS